jgi:hypothetical protein
MGVAGGSLLVVTQVEAAGIKDAINNEDTPLLLQVINNERIHPGPLRQLALPASHHATTSP